MDSNQEKFLIDTGSPYSILVANHAHGVSPCNVTSFLAVNSSPIHVYGMINKSLGVSHNLYAWHFYVADINTNIIGNDFLSAFEANVNYKDHTFTLDKSILKLSTCEYPEEMVVPISPEVSAVVVPNNPVAIPPTVFVGGVSKDFRKSKSFCPVQCASTVRTSVLLNLAKQKVTVNAITPSHEESSMVFPYNSPISFSSKREVALLPFIRLDRVSGVSCKNSIDPYSSYLNHFKEEEFGDLTSGIHLDSHHKQYHLIASMSEAKPEGVRPTEVTEQLESLLEKFPLVFKEVLNLREDTKVQLEIHLSG